MAPILTSRTAYTTYLQCPRRRYLGFEMDNGTDVRGWERKRMALAPTTGIYVHKVVEGIAKGRDVREVIPEVVAAYRREADDRSLEVEVADTHWFTIDEQAALIEALGWAWARVVWPRLQEEYDVISVEKELRTPLADDVVLQSRCDLVGRRKADGVTFVFNPKTTASADERWYRGWETDVQLLTESLAVEKALGERIGGVQVIGLVKGSRVKVDEKFSEIRDDRPAWTRVSRTPLTWGYKCDGNPPLTKTIYDHAYNRAKGWHKFPVWRETELAFPGISTGSPVESWVAWLPPEVVEAQFAFVPPIMRDERKLASVVRQMVATERRIDENAEEVNEALGKHGILSEPFRILLDEAFPQNTRSCLWPSKCDQSEACWEPGVGEDMAGSGLYRPRHDHHASEEE